MNEKYPLAPLEIIRQKRIDLCISNERAKKLKLQVAIQALEQAKKDLETYKVWKDNEIESRYEKLMGTINTKAQMDKFNEGISSLSLKEVDLQTKIVTCQKQIEIAKKEADEAKNEVIKAQKAKNKLDKHHDLWLAEQKIIQDRITDAELDDFRVKQKEYSLS